MNSLNTPFSNFRPPLQIPYAELLPLTSTKEAAKKRVRDLIPQVSEEILWRRDLSEISERTITHISRILALYGDDPDLQKISRDLQRVQFSVKKFQRERLHETEASMDTILEQVPEELRKPVLQNIISLQLSKGCFECDFCMVNALRGVRKQISLEQGVIPLLDTILENRKKKIEFSTTGYKDLPFLLYGASDPMLYPEILPVLEQVQKKGYKASLSTSFPTDTTSQQTLHEIWKSVHSIRISGAEKKFEKIKGILTEWGDAGNKRDSALQMRPNNLAEHAGKAYDYNSVTRSIGTQSGVIMSPDGSFNSIPTVMCPIYPDGEFLDPINKDTPWIIKRADFGDFLYYNCLVPGRNGVQYRYTKPLLIYGIIDI